VSVTSGLSQPVSGTTTRTQSAPRARTEFEAIFLEHYEGVVRILMRLVGVDQAEELANEVFFRLSRQSDRWLLTNNVGGWLYRTATRAGIDALRAATRRSRYEQAASEQPKGAEAGPLRDILREEDQKKVQLVLGALKPAQAQLLLMRSSGSSYKDIAANLGVATGGVGTLLNRAEAEFRKHYLKLHGKEETL
jgi:RNA polymerase sigma-70 factor (ECF subfamily)